MNRKFRKNKKAMSIVISTVIIIAISITMAIAVAFWAMGLGNSFTKFEKVEFVSTYADPYILHNFSNTVPAPAAYNQNAFPIYIQLQNSGQIAATINNVFLNDKPYTAYNNNLIGAYPIVGTGATSIGGQNLVGSSISVLSVGQRTNTFIIWLPLTSSNAAGWKSGDYVEVNIETTSGHQYSNTVLLP